MSTIPHLKVSTKPRLTIQIVGFNSAADLPMGLTALQKIPRDQVIIRYIDNNSQDGSVAKVRAALPEADIILNQHNVGFGAAHNQGFARCTTPFIMLHNPDLQIEWEGVIQLLEIFSDERIAAVQGKLLRSKSDPAVIDSTGIVLTWALNGLERGAGELDQGQYSDDTTLLAVTGAAGIYRLAALRQIAPSVAGAIPEIIDADFFAYKEDVDLGWRLKRAGWEVRYAPVLQGYHARSLKRTGWLPWGSDPVSIYHRLKNPRTGYSLRNWIWLLTKNASVMQLVLHAPAIFGRGLALLACSLAYPLLLLSWWQAIAGLPRMLQKRTLP